MKIFDWIVRLIVAIILLQTLYFKFTAHPDSVYIFTTLGMEPYGRIGTGIMELFASFLILYPRTIWMGAVLAMGLMVGALFFHLTKLGINMNGDGGILFSMAAIVFVCALITAVIHRRKIPVVNKFL